MPPSKPPNPDLPQRRSIRLPAYDYTQPGAYFVTICTHRFQPTLGHIADGAAHLSAWGEIAAEEWLRTPQLRPYVQLDEWVVMPNHFHAILYITGNPSDTGARSKPRRGTARRAPTPEPEDPPETEAFSKPVPGSLPTIVRSYKSAVTREVNRRRQSPGARFWHRNYYEHVIRDEPDLDRIREYIANNPHTWPDDRFHPTKT